MTGTIWLQHGFARRPSHLDALAAAMSATGAAVERPAIASFRVRRSLNDATYVDSLADEIAATHDDPLVFVGHSAGGAVVARGAARLVARGRTPRGVVLLDANESLSRMLEPALASLHDIPVLCIAAAPSRCNRGGQVGRLLEHERSGFAGLWLTTGTHCDAEGVADRTCATFCGAVLPENATLLRELALAWVNALLAGEAFPTDCVPGSPRYEAWLAEGRITPLATGH